MELDPENIIPCFENQRKKSTQNSNQCADYVKMCQDCCKKCQECCSACDDQCSSAISKAPEGLSNSIPSFNLQSGYSKRQYDYNKKPGCLKKPGYTRQTNSKKAEVGFYENIETRDGHGFVSRGENEKDCSCSRRFDNRRNEKCSYKSCMKKDYYGGKYDDESDIEFGHRNRKDRSTRFNYGHKNDRSYDNYRHRNDSSFEKDFNGKNYKNDCCCAKRYGGRRNCYEDSDDGFGFRENRENFRSRRNRYDDFDDNFDDCTSRNRCSCDISRKSFNRGGGKRYSYAESDGDSEEACIRNRGRNFKNKRKSCGKFISFSNKSGYGDDGTEKSGFGGEVENAEKSVDDKTLDVNTKKNSGIATGFNEEKNLIGSGGGLVAINNPGVNVNSVCPNNVTGLGRVVGGVGGVGGGLGGVVGGVEGVGGGVGGVNGGVGGVGGGFGGISGGLGGAGLNGLGCGLGEVSCGLSEGCGFGGGCGYWDAHPYNCYGGACGGCYGPVILPYNPYFVGFCGNVHANPGPLKASNYGDLQNNSDASRENYGKKHTQVVIHKENIEAKNKKTRTEAPTKKEQKCKCVYYCNNNRSKAKSAGTKIDIGTMASQTLSKKRTKLTCSSDNAGNLTSNYGNYCTASSQDLQVNVASRSKKCFFDENSNKKTNKKKKP